MQGVSDMGNKYQNHYQIQINNILDQTQNLCIEKGIDNVSIVDIARSCHITRTTVYNYFDSKEDILWAIFYRHQSSMYEKCVTAIKQASTTYEKFQAYAYTTLSLYKENIYYPIFMDIFGSIYMSASAIKTTSKRRGFLCGYKPLLLARVSRRCFHFAQAIAFDSRYPSKGFFLLPFLFLFFLLLCNSLFFKWIPVFLHT